MRPALAVLAGLAVACAAAGPAGSAGEPKWIAAWGAPLGSVSVGGAGGGSGNGPSNATVRNIARVTLGGSAIRIRLSNAAGQDKPLVVGAATVALQKAPGSPELVPGTTRPVTFGGKPSITVAPKTDFVYSDPVDLPVSAQQNLAVSLFLPGGDNPGAPGATYSTQFATADDAGDATGDEPGTKFSDAGTSTYALTAVDVLTTEADGAVVGLGSSTFHGNNSTQDGYNRVLDLLSVRIDNEIAAGRRKGIVSAGIGGDTLHAGLSRMDRDVFSQTGVTGVIVYDVNDLSSRTAEEIEGDYRIVIARSHERGLRVFCTTWPPAAQSAPATIKSNERRKLNAWILNSGECDDIVDWDAVLRGAAVQDEYDPTYFSDGIHPNPAGHKAMADATPMRWFRFDATAPGGFAGDLGLPATRRCVSRRVFTIHVRAPSGQRLRSARIWVNGRLARTVRGRGRAVARVDLRGLRLGTSRVQIVLRAVRGRTYVRTRTYHTCVPQ